MFTRVLMVGTALGVALMAFNAADLIVTGATAEPKRGFSPRVSGPPRSTTINRNVTVNRNIVRPNVSTRSRVITKTNVNVRNINVTKTCPRFINPPVTKARLVGPGTRVVGPGMGLRLGPGGAARVRVGPRPVPGAVVRLNNRVWPITKSSKMIWWGGGWKRFLPYAAIPVVVLGGAYYWADGFVSVGAPYCSGVTPDGCRLNWQEVGFEGGGSTFQCVQFCRRPGVAPPAEAVALVSTPPAPTGRCELTIYALPGMTGENAPTSEDQPRLGEVGWKDQIASIQVAAGTWDFFTEDEYQGQNMRLPPGPYPELGPEWTKKIGSFMCVQGG